MQGRHWRIRDAWWVWVAVALVCGSVALAATGQGLTVGSESDRLEGEVLRLNEEILRLTQQVVTLSTMLSICESNLGAARSVVNQAVNQVALDEQRAIVEQLHEDAAREDGESEHGGIQ